ncbi:hypothetical protein GJ496_006955 [Pomphorhynchus laevis]|nr:hypothetical protein GJ496_006955 [Pomphorhynchus laevis]
MEQAELDNDLYIQRSQCVAAKQISKIEISNNINCSEEFTNEQTSLDKSLTAAIMKTQKMRCFMSLGT